MRLLIIQGGFGAGGAEKNIAKIAAHRLAQGDDVRVMGFYAPAKGSYFCYPDGVELVLGKPAKGPAPIARLLRIRGEIKTYKPDLIVSFLTKINVLTLMAGFGVDCPVIISERNNPRAQNAHPIWHHAQNMLSRRAAALVMQTERARADLPNAVQPRAHVIPNPCEPIARINQGDTSHTPQLVAVGRLDPQKGFDLLIKAMCDIHAAHPHAKLTIFGDGPARQQLEAMCDSFGLGDVISMPGASETPGGWIATADLLIAPSRFEGFPNVVAEAVVSGLPVLASDCNYGPREMIQDGVNGRLVPVGDPNALASATIALLDNPTTLQAMQKYFHGPRDQLDPKRILRLWDELFDATVSNHQRTTHYMRKTPSSA